MESIFMHPFFWFFLGVFAYRFFSRILSYVHAIHIYNDSIVSALSIYRLCDYKVRAINAARYKYLKSQKDLARLEKEKEIDTAVLVMWRTVCIAALINQLPKNIRRLAKFSDWKTAMSFLETLTNGSKINKWGNNEQPNKKER